MRPLRASHRLACRACCWSFQGPCWQYVTSESQERSECLAGVPLRPYKCVSSLVPALATTQPSELSSCKQKPTERAGRPRSPGVTDGAMSRARTCKREHGSVGCGITPCPERA